MLFFEKYGGLKLQLWTGYNDLACIPGRRYNGVLQKNLSYLRVMSLSTL